MIHKFISYLLKNQVVLVLFLILIGWFILQIRGILTLVFLSYIITTALNPFVQILKKRNLPHILAVLIPYLLAIVFIVGLVVPLIPFTVMQVQALGLNLPEYADQAARSLGFRVDAEAIRDIVANELGNISRNAFAVTSRVFGGVFSTLTILIVTFYMMLYHGRFKHFLASFFHKNDREKILGTFEQVDDKLGAWLQGQIVLSLFIFGITWVVLTVLGVPTALPLAILAGLLEIVPTLGPILASIPAIIVAFTISPTLAIIVAIAYIVIQALENNVLVPKIMQRAVGLNPIIVIVGVLVGANLMGVTGALLSIPFISFIVVLYTSLRKNFDDFE